MADEVKNEEVKNDVVETVETQTTGQPDIETLINEKVESVKLEWMKRFDQKNTEATQLKKQIAEMERAKLSEKERLELERKDLENELNQKRIEVEQKELNFNKSMLIAEMKLDKEYIDIVTGSDIDTFKSNISVISKKINDEVERRVNERLGGSVKPAGNTNNDPSIQDEIARLTKEGNLAEAIALQNKLYSNQ